MSTRAERFNEYMESVDNYIKHQMAKYSDVEKQVFREKQIAMYNDEIEHYAEKLKKALSSTK